LDEELLVKVLQAIKDYEVTQYDLDNDPKGLHRWLRDVKTLLSKTKHFKPNLKLDDIKALSHAIEVILKDFKSVTEDEGFWSLFWTRLGDKDFKHASESYSQMIFAYLCAASLKSSGVKVKNIYKGDQTIVRIEFDDKNIFIHIKHSDNNQLKSGYEKILEKAKELPRDRHLYLIINFKEDNPKQLNQVKVIENELCKIYHINAAVQLDGKDVQTISFDGLDIQKLHQSQQKLSKNAKAKHEKTDAIKYLVVKPMFLAKRGENNKRKVSEIISSIERELNSLEELNLDGFAKKYSIDKVEYLEQTLEYLSSKEDGGQISEWCYQISQGKL